MKPLTECNDKEVDYETLMEAYRYAFKSSDTIKKENLILDKIGNKILDFQNRTKKEPNVIIMNTRDSKTLRGDLPPCPDYVEYVYGLRVLYTETKDVIQPAYIQY